MTSSSRPIGIFDSGLGGLTVFNAVRRLLPHENLIYFGDTAHVPYGSKSAQTVTTYSLEIARFLCEKRIKLLMVACNTASALTLDELRRQLPIPVIGVLEPGAHRALAESKTKRIGVIGTEATIKSNAYTRKIHELDPAAEVHGLACPLFVPLVEEGWWKHRVTRLVAAEYLNRLRPARVDTLILGCTHYPVIKETIAHAAGAKVKLIDSAEAAACEARELLRSRKLDRKTGKGAVKVYASDDPVRFGRLAANLLGSKLGAVELKRFS
jgi:glutamate racemase